MRIKRRQARPGLVLAVLLLAACSSSPGTPSALTGQGGSGASGGRAGNGLPAGGGGAGGGPRDDAQKPATEAGPAEAGASEAGQSVPDARGVDLASAEAAADSPPAAPQKICNGEARITFSFVTLLPLSDTEPGSQLVWENGSSYLRIDGQCRFWTFGTSQGNSPLDDIRTGTLSAADADKIAADLRFGEWAGLQGDHGRGFNGATAAMLSNGVSEVVCWALCTHPNAPAAMRDLFTKATTVLDRLSALGQPMTGPVRLALQNRQGDAPDFPYPTVPWPLTRALTDFVIPFGIAKAGSSFKVEGADADELRKLRRGHRNSAALKSGVAFVPIKQGTGPLHSLYVRDTLPYEDATGLLPRK